MGSEEPEIATALRLQWEVRPGVPLVNLPLVATWLREERPGRASSRPRLVHHAAEARWWSLLHHPHPYP